MTDDDTNALADELRAMLAEVLDWGLAQPHDPDDDEMVEDMERRARALLGGYE